MLKKFYWIGILSFLLVLGWSHPKRVWAVNDGLSLVISPLPINLVTTPNSTVSAQLKIKNNGAETEKIHVGLMKFDAYGEEGHPRLLDRANGDSYFDWVTFSENDFNLVPNEWKTVTMTISVPQQAAFGYYYAVTFSRADDPVLAETNRATKIVGASASLVLLEVRVPQAVRKIDIEQFYTGKRIFEFLPVDFNLKLTNLGNVHVAPHGNIFVDSMFRKDEAILEVNPYQGNVLPNSKRIFTTSWNDGFPVYQAKVNGQQEVMDSKGKVIQELKWNFADLNKLRWGKYTAHLLLVYDDGAKDVPIEGDVSFWVIPWRLLGGALVLLSLVVIGLYSVIFRPIWWLVKKIKKND